jgi:amidase
MNRRHVLQMGMAGIVAPAIRARIGSAGEHQVARSQPARVADDPEHTIAELQAAMSARQTTAHTIAERYLARIESVDRSGPTLRSVTELNPDALAIADELDRERASKGPRGPLHGVPILIKDNIDTADRMRTSAGSLALADWTPPHDAFLVARLRAAGAVILGKTNLSEWANFRSMHSTSGWSGRGGLTRNPYVLDRNACGSSTGSGVAVAANLCAAAIGTETDGSIVCPSTANGIVGLKPTLGLVSRSGIIPIAASQDTAGPMARTVSDAAAVLSALTGIDPQDPATKASGRHIVRDYAGALDVGALKGVRLGVMRNFFGFHDGVDRLLGEALAAMKAAGAVLIDPANLPTKGRFDDAELEVLLYEFKDGLNKYLGARPNASGVRSLSDLIEFNEANASREMPWFGQDLLERAQKKGPLTSPAYLKARRACVQQSRTLGLDAVMTKHRLDALVSPSGGPAWLTDLVNGDHFGGGSSTPAAVAGYPSITVPAGLIHGLPIGVSFTGRPWSDAKLLAMAFAFEQPTKLRRPPTYAAAVGA